MGKKIEDRSQIVIGRYILSPHKNHKSGKDVLWLETDEGEGTEIDLDKLFEREM